MKQFVPAYNNQLGNHSSPYRLPGGTQLQPNIPVYSARIQTSDVCWFWDHPIPELPSFWQGVSLIKLEYALLPSNAQPKRISPVALPWCTNHASYIGPKSCSPFVQYHGPQRSMEFYLCPDFGGSNHPSWTAWSWDRGWARDRSHDNLEEVTPQEAINTWPFDVVSNPRFHPSPQTYIMPNWSLKSSNH